MDWTTERVAKLAELWQAGLSASQVARQLGEGLSRNAVIGKIHRMGLKARAIPSRPRAVAVAASERPRRATSAAPGVARSLKRSERVFTPRPAAAELTPTACIHTLTEATCRWPIGDPGEADFGYCGRSRPGSGPYCQHHTQVAFRPAPVARPRGERRPLPHGRNVVFGALR